MNGTSDLYFKKSISFKYEKEELIFKVSQDLFSSNIIDYGTQRLLKTLSSEELKFEKALDLGCGYGVIGISLKKINPKSEIHMVDRDALALEYSLINVNLNGITGLQVYGSLGYDNIKDNDFDLIISNIPAKVGERVLSHMLLDAHYYLRPNGQVAVVVIKAITKYVSGVLKSRDDIEILFQKSWHGHTVFHYKFKSKNKLERPKTTAFERGVYDRTISKFSFNKETFSLKTTYNLPEFDTLSFDTKLLLNNLYCLNKKNIRDIIVFNSGQGYIAVALSKLMQVDKMILVDRNLQSLEVSRRNLILNKYPKDKISLSHQVNVLLKNKRHVDLVIGIIPEKQSNEVYKMIIKQSVQQLKANGMIMFASSSNVIFKLGKIVHSDKRLTIIRSKRSKGKKVLTAKLKKHNGD